MNKLLRTIRFDETDARVFETAAAPGEWATSGAFAFALGETAPADLAGKARQAFANGFLGLASFGRSTFATVGEASDADRLSAERMLADHLVRAFGAPDMETALAAARDELRFVADLCHDVPINTVFTVRRHVDRAGDVREEFRRITPPSGEPSHARVWSIEPEQDGKGSDHGA